MTYQEAREFVNQAAKKGSILGLETMKRLMEKLKNPQDQQNVIHIAGTNGKGSTLAYLTSILKKAGYRVGRYNSPAVFDYLEIFTINDVNISEADYAKYMEEIAKACDVLVEEGFDMPTAFEIETALAYLYFYGEKCDVTLIETGMGGDEDATNIVKNTIISIISSISMDHMRFLGNTVLEIASHKAGIIKDNSVVVCAVQSEDHSKEIEDVIQGMAMKKHADFIKVNEPENLVFHNEETLFDYCLASDEKRYHLSTGLLGVFQPYNASAAIETAICLRKKGFHIKDEDIVLGILETKWHGRFEKIRNSPLIYFDGGHNPDAAKLLAKSMEIYFTNKKIIYIIGVLADKDYDKILALTAGFADTIITITPNNIRALDGEALMREAKKYHHHARNVESIDEAIKKAVGMSGKDGVVFIFGSLSYLKEAREACLKI